MRKVVAYSLVSLDGVAEEPGDWMTDSGAGIFANLAEVIATQTTVLLGRATYDYWVDFWPHDGPEPFRSFINDTPKHVFTSQPLHGDWQNTEIVVGDAADHVRALRQSGRDGDIGIHGSIALAQSLGAAGLIDEYQLVVAGRVAGNGRRLFPDGGPVRDLNLLASRRTPEGSLLLHYAAASESNR